MQRITHYDGLYGQAEARPSAEYLFSERLETRSQLFGWVIEPHIHMRLCQVFFLETGQVTLLEAGRQRPLTAPVLLLIPPTVLHGFQYSPDATGRILTLAAALVESLFASPSPLAGLLGEVQCLTAFAEPHPASRVRELLTELDEELAGRAPEKHLMLHACLQRLFLVLLRIWQQHTAPETLPDPPALRHFRLFQQRLRQAGPPPNITQLADELALTPVQLNRICRAVVGRSASQLVQEHVLEEARKYLTYTSCSVSEIAYLLHFEYPNYFARFFRKHTGSSPTAFRARQVAERAGALVG